MGFSELVQQNELAVRLGFFFGVLCLMALLELASPRRPLTAPKSVRWLNNLGIVVLNSLVVRILFPAAAVGAALYAQQRDWGLFNQLELSPFIVVPVTVILLDLLIYLQHVAVHLIPLLWRLHRVHHADLDIDVTTGLRFHPLEIILSMIIKITAVLLLGVPVLAVIIFEVLLNATAMFSHSNLKLPAAVDRVVRWFIVTPDMHRVHHSVEMDETNSNYGFNLSCWDRLFRTYRESPRKGHLDMVIGIPRFRDPRLVSELMGMLRIPFMDAPPAVETGREGEG